MVHSDPKTHARFWLPSPQARWRWKIIPGFSRVGRRHRIRNGPPLSSTPPQWGWGRRSFLRWEILVRGWDLRIVKAPWDRNLNFKGCDAFAIIEANGNETSCKNHALRHVAWRTSKLLKMWPPVRPVPDYSPVQRSGAVTRRHYRISSPFLRQTFKAAPPKCNIPTQKTIPRNHVD